MRRRRGVHAGVSRQGGDVRVAVPVRRRLREKVVTELSWSAEFLRPVLSFILILVDAGLV